MIVPHSTYAHRTKLPQAFLGAFVAGLMLSSSTVEAQLPPEFIVYDDGLTRTNVGTSDSQVILRDNPNPPPNPTTVILLDGFSVGASRSFHYRLEGSSVLESRGAGLYNGVFAGSVDLYDTSRLVMSGGLIRQDSQSIHDPAIRGSGSSRTEIVGGTVRIAGVGSHYPDGGPGIYLVDEAELSISGDELWHSSREIVHATGASSVTVSGGSFTSRIIIRATGASRISISDGTFVAQRLQGFPFFSAILTAGDSSRVDILGGTFTSSPEDGLFASGDAAVNVHGGNFVTGSTQVLPGFRAIDNGRINVFGGNFALDGMPVGSGFIPHNGTLTGVLADGTPLNVLATGRVFLVPEPAAWVLAAAALIARRAGGTGKGATGVPPV